MNEKPQAVIVGEVLYDVFAGDQAVLGGAPFNVAWHLQGLGHTPVLVSRIGQDKLGEQILQSMHEWGMVTDAIQLDKEHSTGVVNVRLSNGQPDFEICKDVAYDYIDIGQADAAITMPSIPVLYHGSLAARTPQVMDTILQLRQAAESSFVDINLRSPWWKMNDVFKLMQDAGWLKVNDDELVTLVNCHADLNSMKTAARQLMQDLGIEQLVLTMGSKGALIFANDEIFECEPVVLKEIVDTVGAGDAFSAICMLGILQGWSINDILQRAIEFAAQVCQQRGATSPDHMLYENFREKWQLN